MDGPFDFVSRRVYQLVTQPKQSDSSAQDSVRSARIDATPLAMRFSGRQNKMRKILLLYTLRQNSLRATHQPKRTEEAPVCTRYKKACRFILVWL